MIFLLHENCIKLQTWATTEDLPYCELGQRRVKDYNYVVTGGQSFLIPIFIFIP